jgi:hypothetical protein
VLIVGAVVISVGSPSPRLEPLCNYFVRTTDCRTVNSGIEQRHALHARNRFAIGRAIIRSDRQYEYTRNDYRQPDTS